VLCVCRTEYNHGRLPRTSSRRKATGSPNTMGPTRIHLTLLVFLCILICLCVEDTQAHKLKLLGKFALKKAFKLIKKTHIIPFIIPLPIIRHHHPHHKEVWHVEEHHGWEPHGWDEW